MATFEQFRSTFPEDSNEKGEAFEVFLAEWMFKNHPVLSSQFKKVWRFSDWPKAWSSTDIGTDLKSIYLKRSNRETWSGSRARWSEHRYWLHMIENPI